MKANVVIIARIVALILTVLPAAFAPSPAFGEGMDFVPVIENVAGWVDVNMEKRDSRRTSGDSSSDSSLFSSIERIRIGMDGYIYHPRFIIFTVSGATGLGQRSYSAIDSANNSNTTNVFDEYDIDAMLLPEHPYRLEVFARRSEGSASLVYPTRSIITSEGAIFRYREKPFTLNLSAVSSSWEGSQVVDSKQYRGSGTYALGPFMNILGYDRTDSTSSNGTDALTTDSYFTNDFKLSMLSLTSEVKSSRQTQSSPAEPLIGTDTFFWGEDLAVSLPFNVNADFRHGYQREVYTTIDTPSSPETKAFNNTTTDGMNITHQLYRSLKTSYSLVRQFSEATGGDTSYRTESLGLDYTKNIPTGTFEAAYNYQDTRSTRSGSAAITNESHAAAVPGTFTLNNQSVDQTTISVMVKDPATQNLVPLALNTNYEVLQFGNTLLVSVLVLPSSINPPAASYDFVVAYSLLSSDSTLDTKTNEFRIAFTLFNGLFNPYAIYITSDQQVLEGNYFGGGDYTTTKTNGFYIHERPFSLFAEYTEYQSRLSPYRAFRTSADYQQKLFEDVDILARLSYDETMRPATETSGDYSEKTTTMLLSGHKLFLAENLDLSGTATYIYRTVNDTRSNSYTINPSLKWHVGKLDVAVIISLTYSVSDGTMGRQTYEDDAYYLTVSRRIF